MTHQQQAKVDRHAKRSRRGTSGLGVRRRAFDSVKVRKRYSKEKKSSLFLQMGFMHVALFFSYSCLSKTMSSFEELAERDEALDITRSYVYKYFRCSPSLVPLLFSFFTQRLVFRSYQLMSASLSSPQSHSLIR
jgi:hypothetical protein